VASKIKVDTLETADGTGSIALNNPITGVVTEDASGSVSTTANTTGWGQDFTNTNASGHGLKVTAGTGTNNSFKVRDKDSNERLVVHGNGNVGIGVVPEAWQSTRTALQIGDSTAVWGDVYKNTWFTNNVYRNSSNTECYINDSYAGEITMTNGGITHFKVAPSGTADSAISWTTAMTIDNSGRVTMPSTPAFCATMSANQDNIAVYGTRKVLFDTERFDIGSNFNTSTNTFTAPVTGKYILSTCVQVSNWQGAANWYGFHIITSNKTYFYYHHVGAGGASNNSGGGTVSFVADMDTNDTAYVGIYQHGGSSVSDLVYTGCTFSGILSA
jgi:hypothetical protein